MLRLLTIAPSGGVLNGDLPGGAEVLTRDFTLLDYLDEDACYTKRVEQLHPDGLACPRCGERRRLGIHRGHRAPLMDSQCGRRGRVFNAFTGTFLRGTHRRPSPLLMILRGVAQGTPTAPMARELACDRKELLVLRHRLLERARVDRDRHPLDDAGVEADAMYQDAGGDRDCARRPRRPPAAACHQPEGPRHVRDRPPIASVVGRESGEVRSGVIESASVGALADVIDDACLGETTVNTAEWNGSNRVGKRHGRSIGPSIIRDRDARGRSTQMARGCARCTPPRGRGCGPGCGTSCGRSGA